MLIIIDTAILAFFVITGLVELHRVLKIMAPQTDRGLIIRRDQTIMSVRLHLEKKGVKRQVMSKLLGGFVAILLHMPLAASGCVFSLAMFLFLTAYAGTRQVSTPGYETRFREHNSQLKQ